MSEYEYTIGDQVLRPRRKTVAVSAVRFDSSAYTFAHGAAPRGRGSWAFGPKPTTPADAVTWAHACTLTEAKLAVAPLFAARGITLVYVQA